VKTWIAGGLLATSLAIAPLANAALVDTDWKDAGDGLATSLAIAPLANAALVDTDWKDAGDGLATLHEETGIEWLKLYNTLDNSIEEALSQTGEGALLMLGLGLNRRKEASA